MCTPHGAELPTFVYQRHDLLLTQAPEERLHSSHTIITENLQAVTDISLPRGIHMFSFRYIHTHTHTLCRRTFEINH